MSLSLMALALINLGIQIRTYEIQMTAMSVTYSINSKGDVPVVV